MRKWVLQHDIDQNDWAVGIKKSWFYFMLAE